MNSSGTQATGGGSYRPAISADGRYVAFESNATDLVSGDTNGMSDIFLHDRQTGATTRVSVNSAGTQTTDGDSSDPDVSDDGRYVAFESNATNLVSGDTNSQIDIFLRDRQAGTTARVSVNSSGSQATGGHSYDPSLSSDGRHVALRSFATNLVSSDTNGFADIFVRDRQEGSTERVSVDSSGSQATGGILGSDDPSISDDGRYVAFSSEATNLVSGDTNGFADVFVHDRGPSGKVYLPIIRKDQPPQFGRLAIINNTGGTLSMTLSGLGTRTFGAGTSYWEDIPVGTYSWTATTTACAGSLSGTVTITAGGTKTLGPFTCGVSSLSVAEGE